MSNPLISFVEQVFNSPVESRRSGLNRRRSSIWMRLLAFGFLAGIAAAVAVRVYDRRLEGLQPSA